MSKPYYWKFEVIDEYNNIIFEREVHDDFMYNVKDKAMINECERRGFLFKKRVYKNSLNYPEYRKFLKYFKYNRKDDCFKMKAGYREIKDAFFKKDDGTYLTRFVFKYLGNPND